MFEKAIVRSPAVQQHVDLGVLGETLLFYSSVQLVLDRGALANLLEQLGAETTIRLLNHPGVSTSYVREGFAILSTRNNGVVFNRPVSMLVGAKRKAKATAAEEIEELVERTLIDLPKAARRKLAKRILESVKSFKFDAAYGTQAIIKSAESDIASDLAATSAARAVIETLLPGYAIPEGFYFRPVMTGKEGYIVDTNLVGLKIDEAYGRVIPATHSTLTPAYILGYVLNARVDTFFAAEYLGELVTGPARGRLIRERHFDFIRRRDKSAFDLRAFQEVTLKSGTAIGDAIRDKRKTFDELLDLAERANRFKSWLRTASPDETLLASFFDEVRRESWVDKLPSKTFRFIAATGLGLLADLVAPTGIGATTGIGLGAADTFVLDKMLKGWKPNQFVEKELVAFAH